MHKRSSSYEVIKTTSENFNSIPFQTPSSPLMQLTQNEMYSNETNQPITNLRRKRHRKNNKQLPLKRIKQLQMNQMLTNSKLDFITKILLSQFPSFIPLEKIILKKSSFCFSFSKKINQKYYDHQFKQHPHECENENELFDYFNIKPESSFVSEGEFKDKFIQPDKLIAFKFLEDTEMFNNKNNVLTNNFNKLTSNPFTQSANKSDGELKQFNQNSNSHSNNTNSNLRIPNKSGSHIENNELINNLASLKDDISLSLVNYDDEKKDNMKDANEIAEDLKEETNTIKDNQDNERIVKSNLTVSQNTSQSNITSSIQSGSNVAKSSQDRFRKVRGFNFKNNIKTKKFAQGIMLNSEDKSHGIKYLEYKKVNKKKHEGNVINEAKVNEFSNKMNDNHK